MKKLEDNYPKTIFVNLDDNHIIYPEHKIKKMLKRMPLLNDIKTKLKEIYQDFNKNVQGYISEILYRERIEKAIPATKKKPAPTNLALSQKPKSLIYNQNKIEDEKCKKIFQIFKNTFEFFTLNKLPVKPIIQENNEVAYIYKNLLY